MRERFLKGKIARRDGVAFVGRHKSTNGKLREVVGTEFGGEGRAVRAVLRQEILALHIPNRFGWLNSSSPRL